jgi:hypothetical protein
LVSAIGFPPTKGVKNFHCYSDELGWQTINGNRNQSEHLQRNAAWPLSDFKKINYFSKNFK